MSLIIGFARRDLFIRGIPGRGMLDSGELMDIITDGRDWVDVIDRGGHVVRVRTEHIHTITEVKT